MQRCLTLRVKALSPYLLMSVEDVPGLGRILFDICHAEMHDQSGRTITRDVGETHLALFHDRTPARVSVEGTVVALNPVAGAHPCKRATQWIEVPTLPDVAAAVHPPSASAPSDLFTEGVDPRVFTMPWCLVLRVTKLTFVREHAHAVA